ncbi:Probable serine/threonine-protein kinase PBL28 [Geodia barretti]|uniref:Probable serine/threonine-protein kinase PBL28 n=1 Tax=Geodia barretti TaxID=519541 RepID=A0AA35R2I3_GEOBA|nr:Probable serine/threonine-protein kinase PBL28 [Geodia barretti]
MGFHRWTSFIHPVIQEFLAAFHISSQPQNHQISFYNEQFQKNVDSFLNVALFHFGLTRLETEEFLNPSKIILAPMIESLAHIIEKKAEFRLELQILIVGCLFEAHDTTLVKHYTQQFTPLMNINFPDVRALDDARMTAQMIFVILQSGINLWEIIIPNENARGKTDSLVFPITMIPDTSVSIEVKVQPGMSQSFTLGAIFEPKTPAKTGRATEMLKRATNEEEREMYFKLAMICTGQRETLHRVTQLYSPVPVRSDATDPAYASLIACDCVEKTLATEVVFEPIHPIHMVQLGSKSKKAKAAEGDQDVTSRRHMEQKHKSCYMEMIVLNRPSVKSITFQPPGGSPPCRLVMSGEKDSPSTSGRIAMEANIESVLEDSVGFTECVPVAEKEHGKSTMVPHGLPLPKSKSKMEADKGNVRQGAEVSGSRVHNNDGDIPATAAQVAPSHKHFQDQDILPYNSPALAQAESSEKITWRPGMIMHSTIPDVFQKHKTYPLPEEDKQIRRGGNGQIFATEYFGYSLVAKKTLFRNREYNIILRLNHANIVPLLALMVGEVSHRRRFYCYHMLPRMSGDAARMLSDHPELTLATLKEKNSEDPRKFGLALGNMRYLLAEVLKGIAYMHSLHVVHRDVKASNILVRFHCQHENLLWCTCPHKYTVCVCDFDAAVEMDEEDKMLPISSTNQVFYLPPVGTQGFRSPEGSQLVVASHRDSIDPQLTPQTDIWSLGVLMLRLFLGEDGPGSQRQNAILQLKYHQTKRNVEGRHRNMQELVEDPLVEKILKLPLLRAKLSGVNHLVGFVSGCLRLDPQERPSASDLLKHKFLY